MPVNNNTQTASQSKVRIEEPKMFNVIMHNDDMTTMEFVVKVLRIVFFKSLEAATQLMLDVHHKDAAIIGTYSYDVAVSKATKGMQMAREENFPLRLSIQSVEQK